MKVIRWLDNNIEKVICVALLALMSIIIVVQVFFRYVLQNSLQWSEEIARYMFIWLIYIGISYGVKMDKHIAVDAVYSFLPKKVKPIYALIGYVIFLVFAIIVVYYGVLVTANIAGSGQISNGAHVPMQYVYVAPVVGMSLTLIRLVQRLVIMVKAIKAGEGIEE
jgi:TRAP-type C4-dicarboxylate transport system permease small subunit